jgi:hypothetical protein
VFLCLKSAVDWCGGVLCVELQWHGGVFEINCRLVWWCALCEVYSGVVVCLKSTVDWCDSVLCVKCRVVCCCV